ncbi:unnamed protein product [Linum trigynum]|uniref:B3 domain-containing protein n=1 Tax=Linum trigynum TaxID=586398 RepID=A0AAV2C6Y9_9ROSI
MRVLKKSDGGPASGRRPGGIIAGGSPAGLEFLADIAAAVSDCEELCGCGHSDPRICFLTVKKRKSLFLQTHHSLLQRNPSNPPINHRPNTEHSLLLPQNHRNPPIKIVIKHKPLPEQQHSAVKVSVFPPSPAVVAPVSLPQQPLPAAIPPSTVSPAAETRRIPVGFAAPLLNPRQVEEFPLSLKARVSATVGGEGVCSLASKFSLVIRKKLRDTDLRLNHNRLSIPGRQISTGFLEFLTDEERRELKIGGKIKLAFFLDPDFQIAASSSSSPSAEGCKLGRWKMNSSEVYIVNGGGWKWLLRKNQRKLLNLSPGDEMELWSFRTVNSGELCFAFIAAETRRRRAAEKEIRESGNSDCDEKPVEQESAVAAMGRTEYGSSKMDSSSNSSTLTHQEQEEQRQHLVLDLSLRM